MVAEAQQVLAVDDIFGFQAHKHCPRPFCSGKLIPSSYYRADICYECNRSIPWEEPILRQRKKYTRRIKENGKDTD